MSLRKWAAALISAPQARGHKAVSASIPTAPVKASKALLGPNTLQRVDRRNHQVIKQSTLTSRRQKCTPIFLTRERNGQRENFRPASSRRHARRRDRKSVA